MQHNYSHTTTVLPLSFLVEGDKIIKPAVKAPVEPPPTYDSEPSRFWSKLQSYLLVLAVILLSTCWISINLLHVNPVVRIKLFSHLVYRSNWSNSEMHSGKRSQAWKELQPWLMLELQSKWKMLLDKCIGNKKLVWNLPEIRPSMHYSDRLLEDKILKMHMYEGWRLHRKIVLDFIITRCICIINDID